MKRKNLILFIVWIIFFTLISIYIILTLREWLWRKLYYNEISKIDFFIYWWNDYRDKIKYDKKNWDYKLINRYKYIKKYIIDENWNYYYIWETDNKIEIYDNNLNLIYSIKDANHLYLIKLQNQLYHIVKNNKDNWSYKIYKINWELIKNLKEDFKFIWNEWIVIIKDLNEFEIYNIIKKEVIWVFDEISYVEEKKLWINQDSYIEENTRFWIWKKDILNWLYTIYDKNLNEITEIEWIEIWKELVFNKSNDWYFYISNNNLLIWYNVLELPFSYMDFELYIINDEDKLIWNSTWIKLDERIMDNFLPHKWYNNSIRIVSTLENKHYIKYDWYIYVEQRVCNFFRCSNKLENKKYVWYSDFLWNSIWERFISELRFFNNNYPEKIDFEDKWIQTKEIPYKKVESLENYTTKDIQIIENELINIESLADDFYNYNTFLKVILNNEWKKYLYIIWNERSWKYAIIDKYKKIIKKWNWNTFTINYLYN